MLASLYDCSNRDKNWRHRPVFFCDGRSCPFELVYNLLWTFRQEILWKFKSKVTQGLLHQGQNTRKKIERPKQVSSVSTCTVSPLVKVKRENLPASSVISKSNEVGGQSLSPRHPDVHFGRLKINVGHIKNVGFYTAKFSFLLHKKERFYSFLIHKTLSLFCKFFYFSYFCY